MLFILTSLLVYGASADMLTGLPPNLFGHKCSYFWHNKNITMPTNQLMDVTNGDGKTCTAVQLNYVGRHGARYPSTDDYASFETLRTKLVTSASNIDNFSFLKTWQNFPPKTHGHVEDIGRWELHYLGDYYGKGLHRLFHGKVSPSSIKLTGSSKKRTRTSASEFYKALSKSTTGNARTDITPTSNNTMLRNYETCPRWETGVLNNKTHNHEVLAFENSSLFQNVIQSVSKRLGLDKPLTFDELRTIYLLCPTDLSVNNATGWCSMFTPEEMEIMNYQGDLWDYYNILYGHPILPRLTCPIWQDVFSTFEGAINSQQTNQEYLIGNLRFGHSHSLDMFYASLGIFKDSEPLRADNYLNMKNRTFVESRVTPFSAHVAFVMYNCGGAGPESYLIKMFVNQQPMVIPGCGNVLCPYTQFKALLWKHTEHCNLDKICATSVAPIVGNSSLFPGPLVVLTFIFVLAVFIVTP